MGKDKDRERAEKAASARDDRQEKAFALWLAKRDKKRKRKAKK